MLRTTVNGTRSFSIALEDGRWTVNGSPTTLDVVTSASGIYSILYRGKSYEAVVEHVDKVAKEVVISIRSQRYTVAISEPIDLLLRSMGLDAAVTKKIDSVKAPMPGMVLKVLVQPGQQIAKGDGLLILEAMKMENVLKAAAPATVKGIRVQERTAVEKGAVLIDLE